VRGTLGAESGVVAQIAQLRKRATGVIAPMLARDRALPPRNLDVDEPALALSESSADSEVRRDERARIGLSDVAVAAEDAAQQLHGVQHRLRRRVGRHPPPPRRRLDSQTWNTVRLVCGGWWMGWTSATIARIGYPPPKQLTPAGEKRLRIISIVLIALGLASTFRMFAAGKRPPGSTSGA